MGAESFVLLLCDEHADAIHEGRMPFFKWTLDDGFGVGDVVRFGLEGADGGRVRHPIDRDAFEVTYVMGEPWVAQPMAVFGIRPTHAKVSLMSVGDILRRWLAENGYDGLFNEDGWCGCHASDIGDCPNTCDGMCDCLPAYEIAACQGCEVNCDLQDGMSVYKGWVPDCEHARKESGHGG